MVYSGLVASSRHRSMVAGSASLALHGGLIVLAVALTGELAADESRRSLFTPIEVVNAVRSPVPAVPPQVVPPAPIAEPRAVAPVRHGPETPERPPPRPSTVKDLVDD